MPHSNKTANSRHILIPRLGPRPRFWTLSFVLTLSLSTSDKIRLRLKACSSVGGKSVLKTLSWVRRIWMTFVSLGFFQQWGSYSGQGCSESPALSGLLSHAASTVWVEIGSCFFMPRLAGAMILLFLLPCVTGMTGEPMGSAIGWSRWEHSNFLPRLALNCNPSDFCLE
jgi:hypothetical protein